MSEQDWQTFDLTTIQGREQLNRLIAERVGWKPEQVNGLWRWRNGDQKWGAPDSHATSAEAAWEYSYRRWHLPHYCEDVDSALGLIVQTGLQNLFSLHGVGTYWEARIASNVYREIYDVKMHANNPAFAICLAWLVYDDYQKAAQS